MHNTNVKYLDKLLRQLNIAFHSVFIDNNLTFLLHALEHTSNNNPSSLQRTIFDNLINVHNYEIIKRRSTKKKDSS